jgi:hypothetical protein
LDSFDEITIEMIQLAVNEKPAENKGFAKPMRPGKGAPRVVI